MDRVNRVATQVTARDPNDEAVREVDVLIVGGGVAGVACAQELIAILNETLEGPPIFNSIVLVDSNDKIGGALWKHDENLVGVSEYFPYAGLPSSKAAEKMVEALPKHHAVEVFLEATAIATFSDGNVGVHAENDSYLLFRPKNLVISSGSREEFIIFNGNTLSGVVFLWRFLKLKNLQKKRIVFVGGTNAAAVGALGALRKGANVVALVAKEKNIYQVHLDALERCGVKIIDGVIASATGDDKVTGCLIRTGGVDGHASELECDMIVIAAGLIPQVELGIKARLWDTFPTFDCGEADGLTDITLGHLSGRRVAREIAKLDASEIREQEEELKRDGLGKVFERNHVFEPGGHRVFPVIHDRQEMACTVCKSACPKGLIAIDGPRGIPRYVSTKSDECNGCGDCLASCPGDAITLIDTRWSRTEPNVTFVAQLPLPNDLLGTKIAVFGRQKQILGHFPVEQARQHGNKTLVTVKMPQRLALDAVGQARETKTRIKNTTCAQDIEDLGIVCRCEHVTKSQIMEAAKRANNDMNQVKALTRQGMGQCGGFQCTSATEKLLGNAAVRKRNVRAMNLEISLGTLAQAKLPPHPKSRNPQLPFERAQQENYHDVIVLGAGSIGVPTAMFLKEKYGNVLVIESKISCGQGDNKRAIGGVRATFGNPGKIIVSSESIEIIRSWKQKYGDDLEWKDGGYLFVVYTEEHEESLKSLLPTQHKFGLEIDWIDREKVIELVPGVNQEGLRGGVYSPKDGMATPYLASNAFFRRAKELGVQFLFNISVVGFLKDDMGEVNGVTAVDSQGRVEKYYAPIIINALGAKCNEVLATEGISLPISVDSHEGGVTRPAAGYDLKPLVIDIRAVPGSMSFYFYQNVRGQIVFCITPDPPIIGFDRHETSQFLPQISRRIINLIPELKNVEVRRVWRGLYANTADGNPLVGWDTKVKGLFHACGMGGQGFMLGCGIAKLICRMLTNEMLPNDEYILKEFNPSRNTYASEEKLR